MLSSYSLEACPSCSSLNIKKIGSFGDTFLCDDYTLYKKRREGIPLDLFSCAKCSLVFIGEVVDPHSIYDQYLYVTQSSPGLDAHFATYASDIIDVLPNRHGTIIDIGGNDGTLLSHLAGLTDSDLVNVEPSARAISNCTSKRITSINSYFDSEISRHLVANNSPINCVLMNNMLANIPALVPFATALAELFDGETIGIVESSYLLDMIKNNVIDFIYHEHLYYLSVSSLQNLFHRVGLEIFDVRSVPTKGGSLRYYIRKKSPDKVSVCQSVTRFLAAEKNFLRDDKLSEWFNSIKASLNQAANHFAILTNNTPVPVYGASPTTATLLSLISEVKVSVLIDDNPRKLGMYSPIIDSPQVLSFDYLAIHKPAFIVIAAWRFTAQILSRLQSIPDYDPLLFIPLPEPRIAKLKLILSETN